MGFSGSAAHFDRQALPFAFVTPENAEDSFFCGLAVLSRDRSWFFVCSASLEIVQRLLHGRRRRAPYKHDGECGMEVRTQQSDFRKDKSRSGFNSERLSLN